MQIRVYGSVRKDTHQSAIKICSLKCFKHQAQSSKENDLFYHAKGATPLNDGILVADDIRKTILTRRLIKYFMKKPKA